MRSIPYPTEILIDSVKTHQEIRNKLLLEIENAHGEQSKHPQQFELISKTDWVLEEVRERTWIQLFWPHLTNALKNMIQHLRFNAVDIKTIWYQQYQQNDTHGWHIHGQSQYSGIYYLEYENTPTQIRVNNRIQDIEVSEGDIAIMPSTTIHRCPPVKNNKRRTIIAFNFDMKEFAPSLAIQLEREWKEETGYTVNITEGKMST
jgi:hypothetical protein